MQTSGPLMELLRRLSNCLILLMAFKLTKILNTLVSCAEYAIQTHNLSIMSSNKQEHIGINQINARNKRFYIFHSILYSKYEYLCPSQSCNSTFDTII